jgi:hypothetical protein
LLAAAKGQQNEAAATAAAATDAYKRFFSFFRSAFGALADQRLQQLSEFPAASRQTKGSQLKLAITCRRKQSSRCDA